jgi:glycosyltransferase involved in cell wall biosynthesis
VGVGTGVAATNVPGSRDTIEDGVTGFLADNSVTGIVDVINRMYHTPNMIRRCYKTPATGSNAVSAYPK